VQLTAHANAYVERFIGSVRRECLDHVIVFRATGLQRLMNLYCAYYHQWRTHLSLDKDAPVQRTAQPLACGPIVQVAHIGGLQHHYERRAA
jgi:putative transposase